MGIKRSLLFLHIALVVPQTWAQDEDSAPSGEVIAFNKPNTLVAEALGRAGYWSLSYDRRITPALAFGMGVSNSPISGTDSTGSSFWISTFTIPVYGSLYVLGVPHQIFLTAGVNFGLVFSGGANVTISRQNNSPIALVVGIGYEYRPTEGAPVFRLTPYLYFGPAGLSVNPGLSFGFAF